MATKIAAKIQIEMLIQNPISSRFRACWYLDGRLFGWGLGVVNPGFRFAKKCHSNNWMKNIGPKHTSPGTIKIRLIRMCHQNLLASSMINSARVTTEALRGASFDPREPGDCSVKGESGSIVLKPSSFPVGPEVRLGSSME